MVRRPIFLCVKSKKNGLLSQAGNYNHLKNYSVAGGSFGALLLPDSKFRLVYLTAK